MSSPVLLIGGFVSPFVRKVLVTLHIKGIDYELDPINVFAGSERFTALNPLRQVPVLVHGDLEIADSTVICEYLEELQPSPSIYPDSRADRARARWIEEYADTRLADVLIWRFFMQKAIKPAVWQEAPDRRLVEEATNTLIPRELGWLESRLPAEGFLFGSPTLADYSIASMFRTAAFADFSIDRNRWPCSADFVDRVNGLPAMTRLTPYENATFARSGRPLREVLGDIGVRLSAATVGGSELQPSIMHPI